MEKRDSLEVYHFEELKNLPLPKLPEHPKYAPDFLRIRETIGEGLLDKNVPRLPTPAFLSNSTTPISGQSPSDAGSSYTVYTNGEPQPRYYSSNKPN